MSLILSAATFAAIIVLAVKGYGYRGLYFGLAVAAFGFAWIVRGMIPSDREIILAQLGNDRAFERGTQVFADYGPPVVFWLYALAFGSLIAGCAFRARLTDTHSRSADSSSTPPTPR